MNIANALLKKWLVWKRDACSHKSKNYYLLYQEQSKLNSTYPSKTYYDNNGEEFVITDYTKNVPWFLNYITSPSLESKYYDKYIHYNIKAKEYQKKLDCICVQEPYVVPFLAKFSVLNVKRKEDSRNYLLFILQDYFL